jgi:hypothetical protein
MSRPPWKDFLKKPEVQQMMKQGVDALDPALDAAGLKQREREKRKEFAQMFGLHARITDVSVSREGDVRLQVAFDEDIAFDADDLKELVINGVPLDGARLIEVRRSENGAPRVRAVISANVERSKLASLRSLPLTVTATTQDDVRLNAYKMV